MKKIKLMIMALVSTSAFAFGENRDVYHHGCMTYFSDCWVLLKSEDEVSKGLALNAVLVSFFIFVDRNGFLDETDEVNKHYRFVIKRYLSSVSQEDFEKCFEFYHKSHEDGVEVSWNIEDYSYEKFKKDYDKFLIFKNEK